MAQIVVNTRFLHRLFGMSAGLPSFSCRFIQTRKTGTRITLSTKTARTAGFFMLLMSVPRALPYVSETITTSRLIYLRQDVR
jgi:hypothetical protein